MYNYNMLYYNNLLTESRGSSNGNVDAFLALGEIEVYDDALKAIITVKTEDFVKVVTDAMFKIQKDYKFFSTYIKYSKIFYVPNYPSAMGINTMAVDNKMNLWMNVHFIYNECKMNKDRIFGIIFHELMHNFFKHTEREEAIYPAKHRNKHQHMKSNICQDFEVNASMVVDEIVSADFWDKMNGLYKKDYEGKRWEDILKDNGDEEYEAWLKRSGQKLDDRTKEALKAIEEALKTLRDPESTDAEKERAGEILKKKMDELYGKKDRKIVDKADLSGLRREFDKLMDSQLGDIDAVLVALQNVADDLKTHPKDMSDHDVEIIISDIRILKRELLNNASKIAEMFRKDEDEEKEDIKKSIKSLSAALNILHDGGETPKQERKVIRQAKDDLEAIILNAVDKKRKEEKRKEEIKKHKEKLEKSKEEIKSAIEKREELKKKNPIKKFVDTFKNLQELIKIDRISNETNLTLVDINKELNELVDINISLISLNDIKSVFDFITYDLKKLKKRRILSMSKEEIDKFINDVFDALSNFFKVIVDEKEPSSVKFGAMSLAVEELRKLGKKLKSKKVIKASKEWKDSYKSTRDRLIKIYKEKGKDALKDEVDKMGGGILLK